MVSHDAYFEVFIESSKTDQYGEGAVVPIVKTGSDMCPWATLLKYLSQAKLALLSSPHAGGGSFVVWQYLDEIWDPVRTQSIRFASELSYTRCREILLKQLS